ncbi:MAG TPA: hypothetical protein VM681_02570 [Candidatus Thermoplasmatota archaeon]|nr:hypothetical protein [Candidatus Thermoplasmatota archaeon]
MTLGARVADELPLRGRFPLRVADALFTVASAWFAAMAILAPELHALGLWPHAYFVAMSAQFATLALACLEPRRLSPAPAASRARAVATLVLSHGLLVVAFLLMGFADAMVGGVVLGGPAGALPHQGQLAMVLTGAWASMLAGVLALRAFRRHAGRFSRADAAAVAAALLAGAVGYWGWSWSRFYPTYDGEWFSLWQVGALNVAVEGTIFRFLLVAVPLAHVLLLAFAATHVARGAREPAAGLA